MSYPYTRRVFKFPLERIDEQVIEGPNLTPVSAGMDPQADPCIWGTVTTLDEGAEPCGDPAMDPAAIRRWLVHVVATGNPAKHAQYSTFLGSMTDGPFVWHVFVRRLHE